MSTETVATDISYFLKPIFAPNLNRLNAVHARWEELERRKIAFPCARLNCRRLRISGCRAIFVRITLFSGRSGIPYWLNVFRKFRYSLLIFGTDGRR